MSYEVFFLVHYNVPAYDQHYHESVFFYMDRQKPVIPGRIVYALDTHSVIERINFLLHISK